MSILCASCNRESPWNANFCIHCGDRFGAIGGARMNRYSQGATLVPTSARGRRGGIANRPLPIPTENREYLMRGGITTVPLTRAAMVAQKEVRKLTGQGIECTHTRCPQRCQLCWKHVSRFRRKCPICERYIAPGCWPELCWSDELNHCRSCHAVLGTLKHIRFKIQYMSMEVQYDEPESQINAISYLDFPLGVQINIMVYLFQMKDFLWSPHYHNSPTNAPTCRCPACKLYRVQDSTDNTSQLVPDIQ